MLGLRLCQTVRLFFLRPIFEQFPPQQADLLDGSGFGFIGGSALGNGLIHQIGKAMQACQHLGSPGQSLFQTAEVRGYSGSDCERFIFHEPLQIYKTRPRSQAYFQWDPKICTALRITPLNVGRVDGETRGSGHAGNQK